jgi:gamma-soluble NSF attachment protein
MCFRNAKNLSECKACLLKCADCHKQNRSLFHAAKALDQAILVSKDLNDFSSIRNLAERACNIYQQHGSAGSGATSLDKAAKILEPNYPEDALALYQHALDVSMVKSFYNFY